MITSWKNEYLEDESNDKDTMQMLISLLDKPAKNPDWRLACNYMKLIAVSLTMKTIFIQDNYEEMITSLIDTIADILCV